MRKPTLLRLSTLIAMAAVALSRTSADSGGNVDWGVHRGDAKGTQYSPLAQIHAANVHKLQPAWEYHTRDANQRSTMHVNPIVVNGVMYVTTPSMKAVALDAASGRELWSFDPAKHNNGTVIRLRNRGVAYWKGSEGERIFHFVRERVYGLDAKTGALITSFGENGFIDLRKNLGVDPRTGVHRDDLTRRHLQELPDRGLAGQRKLRRIARPYSRLRHRHRDVQVDLSHHSSGRAAGS